jgi:bile acid:Na+ symporter, BASS family
MTQNLTSVLVQLVLAIIMLSVAFEVKFHDIKSLPSQWKLILAGHSMQLIFLPLYVILLLLLVRPDANMVLAFLLLAACPGGNLSQYFVMRSQGRIGLSMGLTFISTLLSPLTVPLIFYLSSRVNSEWFGYYRALSLPWGSILQTLMLSLFTPLLVGMWLGQVQNRLLVRIRHGLQTCVPYLLGLLLTGAVWSFRAQIEHVNFLMLGLVFIVSFGSLVLTYFLSRLLGFDYSTSITFAWEVSIQNSGLGMVLGIVYFNSVPEVGLTCALWGIWQMAAGALVSGVIHKRRNSLCHQNVG